MHEYTCVPFKKKKRSKNGMEGARAGGCRCWGIGIVIMLSDVLLLSRSNPSECRHGTEGLFTLSISGARARERLYEDSYVCNITRARARSLSLALSRPLSLHLSLALSLSPRAVLNTHHLSVCNIYIFRPS